MQHTICLSAILKTASALEAALTRMELRFARTDSHTSRSVYIRVFSKNGVVVSIVRIADHPRVMRPDGTSPTDRPNAIVIEIGYRPWADYQFKKWYLCLEKIAERSACLETRRLASRIIGEMNIRQKKMPQSFMQVQKNIADKFANRGSYPTGYKREKRWMPPPLPPKPQETFQEKLAYVEKRLTVAAFVLGIELERKELRRGVLFKAVGTPAKSFLYMGKRHWAPYPDGVTQDNLTGIGEGWPFKYSPAQWRRALTAFFTRSEAKPPAEIAAYFEREPGDA